MEMIPDRPKKTGSNQSISGKDSSKSIRPMREGMTNEWNKPVGICTKQQVQGISWVLQRRLRMVGVSTGEIHKLEERRHFTLAQSVCLLEMTTRMVAMIGSESNALSYCCRMEPK